MDKGRMFIGIVLVAVGLVFLIGTVFRVDVWAFCWPVGLIVVGLWLLLRPYMVGPDIAIRQKVLGDIRRSGAWDVVDEEIWIGVGDVRLDMSAASIPPGETKLRLFGFVGDVDVIVPEGVGVSVSSTAFLTDGRVFGQKRESFVVPLHAESDGYATAERKILLEALFFVTNLDVRRA